MRGPDTFTIALTTVCIPPSDITSPPKCPALTLHYNDTVRQAVLCHGDTTMEWARYAPKPPWHDGHHGSSGDEGDASGHHRRGSSGSSNESDYYWEFSGDEAEHQCRDWSVIQGFLEENRFEGNMVV